MLQAMAQALALTNNERSTMLSNPASSEVINCSAVLALARKVVMQG
jgi:hypothetical protein